MSDTSDENDMARVFEQGNGVRIDLRSEKQDEGNVSVG